MVLFLNTTETIGIILGNASTYTTGSMFMTMLVILILIMATAILFGIRLEFTSILVLPLLLTYMAFYKEFMVIGTVIILYLSIILTKNFIFR